MAQSNANVLAINPVADTETPLEQDTKVSDAETLFEQDANWCRKIFESFSNVNFESNTLIAPHGLRCAIPLLLKHARHLYSSKEPIASDHTYPQLPCYEKMYEVENNFAILYKDDHHPAPDGDDGLFKCVNELEVKAQWSTCFTPRLTHLETFYDYSGNNFKIQTMFGNISCLYDDNNCVDAEIFVIPYEHASLTIMMPRTSTDKLSLHRVQEYLKYIPKIKGAKTMHTVMMPKFFIKKLQHNAVDILIKLGIHIPKSVYLTQQSFFSIDEYGTGAYRCPTVVMPDADEDIKRINRPFFFVMHHENGLILNAGVFAGLEQ